MYEGFSVLFGIFQQIAVAPLMRMAGSEKACGKQVENSNSNVTHTRTSCMALYDSIILEIENGELGRDLRATDLMGEDRKVFLRNGEGEDSRYRVGFGFYSEGHIRTEMANNAEQTGFLVRAGCPAKYRRVAKGLYRVIALDEQEELLEQEHLPEGVKHEGVVHETLEDHFVFYLEAKPFQIFDRRRKNLHPSPAVTGLNERLASYYWPDPKVGYKDTEQTLSGFIDRAQEYTSDPDGKSVSIIQLFSDICQWGGVRLPTDDPQILKTNLRLAAQQTRDKPAAMNSAWTKLYSIFYPDDFVIYDSRVATALISIAEDTMEESDLSSFRKSYPDLGIVAGRGGTRPRGTRLQWRNAYTSWSAQLDANRLVKKIASILNKRSGENYNLRQLEAILFMEGY